MTEPHDAQDARPPSSGSGSRAPLLSLTRVQENRLRDHLDERLASLERDERKFALGPLSTLVTRLVSLLHLILQIPPPEPWASMRVAYLLAYTARMVEYVTALPLVGGGRRRAKVRLAGDVERQETEGGASLVGGGEEAEPAEPVDQAEVEARHTLRALLDLIQEVEAGWLAVLAGEAWVLDPTPTQSPGTRGRERGHVAIPVPDAGTPDQTSRVRLRSIVETGREKVLAWARPYGDFGGEILGPDGDEGEEVTPEEKRGWEGEVVGMWRGILGVLDGGLGGDR